MKKTKFLLGLLIITAPLFLAGCYVPFLNKIKEKKVSVSSRGQANKTNQAPKTPQEIWNLAVKNIGKTSYKKKDKGNVYVDMQMTKKEAEEVMGDSFFQGETTLTANLLATSTVNQTKGETQVKLNSFFNKGQNFSALFVGDSFAIKWDDQPRENIHYLQMKEIGGMLAQEQVVQNYIGKWYKYVFKLGDDTQDGFDLIFNKSLAVAEDPHIYQVTKNLGEQEVDGHQCYHLQIAVNESNLKKEMLPIVSDLNKHYQWEGKKLTPKKKQDHQEAVEFFTQILGKIHGEVWIDKNDFYLRKYDFVVDLKKEDFSSKSPLGKTLHYIPEAKFSLSGHLYDFGQHYTISFPQKSVPIALDQLSDIFMGLPEKEHRSVNQESGKKEVSKGQSVNQTKEKKAPEKKQAVSNNYQQKEKNVLQGKDTDGDGLSNLQEIKISSDPYAKDTDGDGYSDGQELAAGFNLWGAGSLKDPQEVPFSILASKNFSARQAFYIFNHYLVFGPQKLAAVFVPKNGTVYKGKNYNLNGLLSLWQKNDWKYWIKSDSSSAFDYCIDRPNVDTECYLVMQPVAWQKGNFVKSGPLMSFFWKRLKGQGWKLISIKLSK